MNECGHNPWGAVKGLSRSRTTLPVCIHCGVSFVQDVSTVAAVQAVQWGREAAVPAAAVGAAAAAHPLRLGHPTTKPYPTDRLELLGGALVLRNAPSDRVPALNSREPEAQQKGGELPSQGGWAAS